MQKKSTTLTSVERKHIQDVLRECDWRINGIGNAAEQLGLHPNTLRFRMRKLGIIQNAPDTGVGFARRIRNCGGLSCDGRDD